MVNGERIRRIPPGVLAVVGAVTVVVPLVAGPSAASAATTASTPGHPADGGSLGLRLSDASTGADPRGQIYIVDHVPPGSALHRRIELSTTGAAVHVGLYAGSATVSNGSFQVAGGSAASEVSSWTAVSPTAVDIPAEGRATAMVDIAVPPDAAPGERYGVVWAEARSTPRNGVVEVNRVGIRIYLSVGPGGAPAPDFVVGAVKAERSSDGRPFVSATVRNQGVRALDLAGSLQLSGGPGGITAGPFRVTAGVTVAIGGTARVVIPLDRALPVGPWDARVTVRSGLVDHAASAQITFPGVGGLRPSAPGGPGAAILIAVILGFLIAGVGGLWLAVNHARRERDRGHGRARSGPRLGRQPATPVRAVARRTAPGQ